MPPTPETKYSPLLSRSSFVAAGCSSAIFFNTPLRANGTAYFNITAVATDDDSVAYDYADFEVEITGIGTGSGITPEPPKVPILDVGLNSGTEDFELILNNVAAAQHPDDDTNPTISIILSDIPEGFDVIGAVWNPVDNYWVASAKDFDEGKVSIVAPEHFAGEKTFKAQALAINSFFLKATSEVKTVSMYFAPDPDGVSFGLTHGSSREDEGIDVDLSATLIDNDGSEKMGEYVYMQLSDGATLSGFSYTVGPIMLYSGEFLTGNWYLLDPTMLNGLIIEPALNWHGPLEVTLAAYTEEFLSPNPKIVSQETFTIDVTAVADLPILTAPASVTFVEDVQSQIVGLYAELFDDVTANGAELLTTTITGVPQDSFFSSGTNTGGGRWIIPVDDLPTLEFLPPPGTSLLSHM